MAKKCLFHGKQFADAIALMNVQWLNQQRMAMKDFPYLNRLPYVFARVKMVGQLGLSGIFGIWVGQQVIDWTPLPIWFALLFGWVNFTTPMGEFREVIDSIKAKFIGSDDWLLKYRYFVLDHYLLYVGCFGMMIGSLFVSDQSMPLRLLLSIAIIFGMTIYRYCLTVGILRRQVHLKSNFAVQLLIIGSFVSSILLFILNFFGWVDTSLLNTLALVLTVLIGIGDVIILRSYRPESFRQLILFAYEQQNNRLIRRKTHDFNEYSLTHIIFLKNLLDIRYYEPLAYFIRYLGGYLFLSMSVLPAVMTYHIVGVKIVEMTFLIGCLAVEIAAASRLLVSSETSALYLLNNVPTIRKMIVVKQVLLLIAALPYVSLLVVLTLIRGIGIEWPFFVGLFLMLAILIEWLVFFDRLYANFYGNRELALPGLFVNLIISVGYISVASGYVYLEGLYMSVMLPLLVIIGGIINYYFLPRYPLLLGEQHDTD